MGESWTDFGGIQREGGVEGQDRTAAANVGSRCGWWLVARRNFADAVCMRRTLRRLRLRGLWNLSEIFRSFIVSSFVLSACP